VPSGQGVSILKPVQHNKPSGIDEGILEKLHKNSNEL